MATRATAECVCVLLLSQRVLLADVAAADAAAAAS